MNVRLSPLVELLCILHFVRFLPSSRIVVSQYAFVTAQKVGDFDRTLEVLDIVPPVSGQELIYAGTSFERFYARKCYSDTGEYG